MKTKKKVIAIVDIETGGFSSKKNAVCEIGFLIIDISDLSVIDSLDYLISPYERDPEVQEEEGQLASYKDDAMAVNGLKVEDLIQDGLTPIEFCDLSIEFLSQYDVFAFMGHNIDSFDKRWLEYFYGRFSKVPLDFSRTIDTMKLAKKKGFKKYGLSDLCNHFKIEIKDAHKAIADCGLTLQVYKQLV